MKKVIKLKNNYENKNNIIYDGILLCRIDVIWNKKIMFDKLNFDNFYISYWGITNKDLNYSFNNFNVNGYKGIHDIFYISNKKNIDLFVTLFDYYDKYIKLGCPDNPHTIKRYHIEYINLINKIEFIFIVGIDLEIERYCWEVGTPGYYNILSNII